MYCAGLGAELTSRALNDYEPGLGCDPNTLEKAVSAYTCLCVYIMYRF